MNSRTALFGLALTLVCVPLLLVWASHSPQTHSELSAAGVETEIAAPPRAIVEEPEYDFGIMDPLQEASHAFVVRNEGGGPLELRLGSTTCKCTLSEISQRTIAPGESGEVVLTWNSGRKHPYYDHGATILTNDPQRSELQLRVRGVVRVQLRAFPEELVLPRVEPDDPASAAFTVYTQTETPFEILQASCSVAGSHVSFRPAGTETLAVREATSGYYVIVDLPAGLPQGQVEGIVQVTVKREGEETIDTVELPLIANVLRRLSVYGPAIDGTGTVDLGNLNPGEGAKHRLIMKVRDEQPKLVIRGIAVEPSFIKAEITPYRTETTATGLYYLDIEVPTDAPECLYLGSQLGEIRVGIDHPRITDLALKLRLIVKRLN